MNAASAGRQVRVTPVAAPGAVRMRTRDLLLLILIGMGKHYTVFLSGALLASVTNGVLILYGWYVFLNK